MKRYLSIVFLYFLFNRSVGKIFLHSEPLEGVYIICCRIFFVIVCFHFLRKIGKNNLLNISGRNLLYIAPTLLSLLLSTIINNESSWQWGQFAYPSISLWFLICLYCSSLPNLKIFIKAISDFHFILAFINFLFLIFSPHFFGTVSNTNDGDLYFLGMENQVGYPLLIGLFFNLLDYHFTKNKKKIVLYALIHIISTFIVFSGTTVVSVLIMYILLLPNPISWCFRKLSLGKLCICIVVLFIAILFMFDIESILELPLVTHIIEDEFQKNTTLSSRTLIWPMVIEEFWKSPIYGYGMGDGNMFFVKGKYLSAHNTILQYLYWGGAMFYISMIPLIYRFNIILKKANSDITHIFKCTICAMFIAFMGEAVNIYFMLNIIFLGMVISKILSANSPVYEKKIIRDHSDL